VARLNPDNLARARQLIELYPQRRSALIPILHVLQEQDGYLTEDGMAHVAELVGLTPAEVRGTASFYDMFHLEPVGKYLVAVCTNIACMLAGAYELLEHIEERLGVPAGGTTPDGQFTLEDAECLALCGNAPCLTVNWRFFGDVGPEEWDQLSVDLAAGRLDAEVPPHGTLNRVRRAVGLPAAGATVHADAATAAFPPPASDPGPPPAVAPGTVGTHPALGHDGIVVELATVGTTAGVASMDGPAEPGTAASSANGSAAGSSEAAAQDGSSEEGA
jgi:NADH-quinone oxidoreductase subunit E